MSDGLLYPTVQILLNVSSSWSFLQIDSLNGLLLAVASLLALLTVIYAVVSINSSQLNKGLFVGCVLLSWGCTAGALLVQSSVLLGVFGGVSLLFVYLLTKTGRDGAGKKVLIASGAWDLPLLVGLYLLARESSKGSALVGWPNNLLMILGVVTIVLAAWTALKQQSLGRLLGFAALAQVGFIILALGTGSALGVAGGLFHLVNYAIFKACLLLSCVAAQRRSGTDDLDKMGGLHKALPIAFLAAVIAALAASALPPLNGFFSKWMIYQAIIEMGRTQGAWLWIVLLVGTVFGTALTLDALLKVIHSVFLGQEYRGSAKAPVGAKAGLMVKVIMLVLALGCVIFGIWAEQVPLTRMIYPAMSVTPEAIGLWQPQIATGLILLGVAAGLVIYLLGSVVKVRLADTYVGGADVVAEPEMRYGSGGSHVMTQAVCRQVAITPPRHRAAWSMRSRRKVSAGFFV